MRPQTAGLSQRVRLAQTPEQQLAALAGRYENETAYVIASGPSLSDVWSDTLTAFLEDKLVISIKGTFTLMPGSADFHVFNRVRHQDYVYPDPPPIRIAVEASPFLHRADIRLPFWFHPEQRWLHSVLFSRAFDQWDLRRSATRCWGPGIVLEMGIYLPVLLGCSRIVFIGWDMNPIDPTHYHGQAATQDQLEEHVVVSNALPQFIPHLARWLASRGMDAYLCSPRSSIPLPQLSVDELIRFDAESAGCASEGQLVSAPGPACPAEATL